jgi:hypothetical protein
MNVKNGKKKPAGLLPKLTETEQDLLSHIQNGYQLETDSLGGNPVLRRLKDNEESKCQSKHTVDRLNPQPSVRSGRITA